MDRRCVFYKKPLLESGTLGTKGNVQVCEHCSQFINKICKYFEKYTGVSLFDIQQFDTLLLKYSIYIFSANL